MDHNDDLLSTTEAAVVLRTTDETLRRWAEQKRIRHIRLPSGHLRFRRGDLNDVLKPVEPEEVA